MSNTIQVRRGAEANLPTLAAGELGFCTDTHELYVGTGSGNIKISTGSGGDSTPVGTIIAHSTGVPTGYLPCDGSQVSRETYSDLLNVIGVGYGNGNGSSTFNLPDLRGYFLRGHDNGAGNDPDAASRTDRGDTTTGDYVGTKQADDYKSHYHLFDDSLIGVGNSSPTTNRAGSAWRHYVSGTLPRGGNETRPINIYVQFCIKY